MRSHLRGAMEYITWANSSNQIGPGNHYLRFAPFPWLPKDDLSNPTRVLPSCCRYSLTSEIQSLSICRNNLSNLLTGLPFAGPDSFWIISMIRRSLYRFPFGPYNSRRSRVSEQSEPHFAST